MLSHLGDAVTQTGKITVVASAAERKAIRAAKKRQKSIGFDAGKTCELGQEVPANALLRATVVSGKKKFLNLSIIDLEKGCRRQSASVPWLKNDRTMAANAVAKLLRTLKRPLQMPGAGRAKPSRAVVTEGKF